MALEDFFALLPLLVAACHRWSYCCSRHFAVTTCWWRRATSLGLAVALFTLPIASGVAPRKSRHCSMVDAYALFYIGLLLAASLAVRALSYGYMKKREGQHEEFYVLVLFATLGAMTLAAATHFAPSFSDWNSSAFPFTSSSPMCGPKRPPARSGIKYLILSGTSSAFLSFRHGVGLLPVRDDGFRRYGLVFWIEPEFPRNSSSVWR